MFSVIKLLPVVLMAGFFLGSIAPASAAESEGEQDPSTSKTAPATRNLDAKAPPKTTEQTCKKLYEKFVPSLQELWRKKGSELRAENTAGYALIEDVSIEYCKEETTRQEIVDLLARILNFHSGKIGIVLPLAKHTYLQHVIAGFQAKVRASNLDPKKVLVIIDNQNKDDRTHQAIASLIFEHKVTAIIGGTEPNDANVLRYWATKIMIPTFLISEPNGSPTVPFVYYSHPTQKSLALAALDANIRFGHKRISILAPSDQHSDRFISAYIQGAKNLGIQVIHQVPYDSKRFDIMESAARKIFRLDPSERQEDLKKLYETAKQHAKQTGETFNPKMIGLQPDIQQDAVMIPDNFKIVRHFSKIFGYLGVRKMPLFGHFEWRSKGLISPWDNFLSGSYFVDFQGAYTSLPPPIAVSTLDSPFFIAPDKIEETDFSLLGWRTMETPLAMSRTKHDMRRKMDALIPRKNDDPAKISFDKENTIVWPLSLFTVTGQGSGTGILNLITLRQGQN